MNKCEMKIPYLDLKKQYDGIKNEINEAIFSVIEKSAYSGGEFVKEFESQFSKFCNCKNVVAVGSGTEAIWLSLKALGVKKGDEVITVPNTFFATVEAIKQSNATPVLVDINEETYNIDINQLESAINKNTKAIIPVHLFGQMTNMDKIMEIARNYNLFVIEDACQAHGAEFKKQMPGYYGDCACFSFYPGKNLGAYGEAGAVVTNNNDLAKKIAVLREHGQTERYSHKYFGWNCRMDGLQGAVLTVKLKYLKKWIDMRRKNAMIYNELLLHNRFLKIPYEDKDVKHVYHIYAIRTKCRNSLKKMLEEKGIQTNIHYPVPIHLQKAYKYGKRKVYKYPVSEACAKELLSLPMYPELQKKQIEYICHEINNMADY